MTEERPLAAAVAAFREAMENGEWSDAKAEVRAALP
jgi:hypothetical protein